MSLQGLARGFVFRNANDGFYYCHDSADAIAETDKDHQVMFHRLGTSAEENVVLLRLPRTRSSKLMITSDGVRLGAIFCQELTRVAVVDFYTSRQDHDGIWNRVCQSVPAPF